MLISKNAPPVPRYNSLSYKETANAVSTANENLGALEIMKGLSSAVDFISQGKGWSYHLLILNSLEKTVQVKSYDRESIVEAVSDLTKAEKEATEGKKIEPVLVSAGPISILRRAYPNFFLDIEEFVRVVSEIVSFAKDG